MWTEDDQKRFDRYRFEVCLKAISKAPARQPRLGPHRPHKAKVVSQIGDGEGLLFGPTCGLIYANSRRCFSNGCKGAKVSQYKGDVNVTLTRMRHLDPFMSKALKFKAIRVWIDGVEKPTETVAKYKVREDWDKLVEAVDGLLIGLEAFERMVCEYTGLTMSELKGPKPKQESLKPDPSKQLILPNPEPKKTVQAVSPTIQIQPIVDVRANPKLEALLGFTDDMWESLSPIFEMDTSRAVTLI